MESLAYLHLELANQETGGEQHADSNNIGVSWDAAGWDEIFDSINAKGRRRRRGGRMTQLQEWADQYRAEIEKESSARAAQVESLLIAGDYEAVREWLDQWESEDKAPGSLRSRYRETRSELRKERYRQRQHQLYGSVIDRITGKGT
jgi:hypothetical protein